MRWGAVTSADANSYQAPSVGRERRGVQLEPLRRAPRVSRGPIYCSLTTSDLARPSRPVWSFRSCCCGTVLGSVIMCPADPALKWQDEMREKFGLDFIIVNSELMAQVRRTHGLHANPFRLFPRVIVSMSWLPPLRAQRLLRDVFATANTPKTGGSPSTSWWSTRPITSRRPARPPRLVGVVTPWTASAPRPPRHSRKCEHRLFLSATPHNGYSESFTALLEMIDGRRFSRGRDHRRAGIAGHRGPAAEERTPERASASVTQTDLFTPSEDEQRQFAMLDRILTDSARANGTGRSGGLVAMLLKKRFLSSPWSFARTLELYEQAASAGRQLDFRR